jgi:hypothetical protein
MKLSKSALMISLLLCLTFEVRAQYNNYALTLRGEVSKFDSAVLVEVNEFRKIRRKLLTYDTLARNFYVERLKFNAVQMEMQVRVAMSEDIIKAKNETIARQDTTIVELRRVSEDAIKLSKKLQISPIPIIDASAKVGAGILIGLIIALFAK